MVKRLGKPNKPEKNKRVVSKNQLIIEVAIRSIIPTNPPMKKALLGGPVGLGTGGARLTGVTIAGLVIAGVAGV